MQNAGGYSQKNLASDLALAHLFNFMVSAHSDGTLNLWQLTFSDVSCFTGIASVTHLRRNCGPRFDSSLLVTHPVLPLIISTSQNRGPASKEKTGVAKNKEKQPCIQECASELMLWRSDLVGPLSQLGGVTETARISSKGMTNFKNVAWFPHLFDHSLVSLQGPDGADVLPCTPCACFVTSSEQGLFLHQVVLDSKTLLSALTSRKASASNLNFEKISELIESEQSGTNSTCIMPICSLVDSTAFTEVQFLHVFAAKGDNQNKSKQKPELTPEADGKTTHKQTHHSNWGPFYVVAITSGVSGCHEIHAWVVNPMADGFLSPITPLSTDSSSSSQFSLSPILASRRQHKVLTTKCLETKQVCSQMLPLAEGINALKFCAATDIPSSTCQNFTCPVSFWISAACSDGYLRFYNINFDSDDDNVRFEQISSGYNLNTSNCNQHKILAVAHAHTLRLAWMAVSLDESISKCPKITVSVAESESSGGNTWKIEDAVELPYELPANVGSDLGYLDRVPLGLTWMSLENGSFILSAALGSSIYILYQLRTAKFPQIESATSSSVSVVKWNILSSIELDDKVISTLTWARDGMLLVGVKNELRVYSQWEMIKMNSNLNVEEIGDSAFAVDEVR